MKHDDHASANPPRRSFLKQAGAAALGAASLFAPVAIGVTTLLDPLQRRAREGGFVRLTTVDSLPEDGTPRRFQVLAERTDAWTRHPVAPIGAVFVRRTGPQAVKAFNVVCPHAGCHVDFVAEREVFFCPCHNSSFGLDGRVGDPQSPSPRGLDELEVELRAEGEVWVKFQNFQTGVHEKRPVA